MGSKIDAGRLAQLVSMPGIDPRMWCSLCAVDKVVVDDDGVFADVHILTTATTDDEGNVVAQLETVRVAPSYAGNGFGFYLPLEQGDEVVVCWPDGDPDHGGMLVGRAWNTADAPPSKAKDNPNDGLLVVKKDANLRIIVQGKGKVVITCDDDGKVLLGDESSTDPVARKSDHITASTVLANWASAVEAGVLAGGGGTISPTFASAAGLNNGLGSITEGSKRVEASKP